jgi:Tol biopolymer transport system component
MKTSVRHKHSLARWVGIAMVQVWLATIAEGASFQLVSGTDPGFRSVAGGGGDSYLPVISRDGRYVLFGSTAQNLAVLGTNRTIPALFPAPINVFLRDRTKGSTVLVSVNLDGTGGGDGDSLPIGVSTNGRYALFESSASNLVPGDTNNAADVFIRDLVAQTNILVSVSTNGSFGDGASYSSVMTPDGRYVAFVSAADNLAPVYELFQACIGVS